MANTYNPYDAVAKIVNAKGNYNTAKATNGNYNQYRDEAKAYYSELTANGYDSLAKELQSVDYGDAVNILKRYKPTTETDNNYQKLLTSAVEASRTPQTSAAVKQIFDSYERTERLLNGENGLNRDYYDTGKQQLDYLNNFDVTKQSYYDPIMSQYKLKGNDAAQGAYARGAADNGGNIDSYAAANANRQQLAFTNAGMQAALNQANQNQQNWQNVYGTMGGHLTDMGNINAKNLQTGAAVYETDATERMNAVNAAANLAQQELQNNINKYIADLEGETAKYQTDSAERQNTQNTGLNKYLAELELQGSKYSADQSLAGTYAQAAADRYKADRSYDAARYEADNKSSSDTSDTENTAYTNDQLAQIIVDGIKKGDSAFRDINSWNDFGEYLIREAGMSSTEAKKLRDYYKEIYPNMFENTPAADWGETERGNSFIYGSNKYTPLIKTTKENIEKYKAGNSTGGTENNQTSFTNQVK